MPVPNTNTFTLADVCNEIGLLGASRNLSQCFTSANAAGFDPLYQGSKDRLSNFRNYNHNPSTLVISPTTRSSAFNGDSFSISVTTTGSPAWTVSDNALWITFTPSSGTGNGTINVTVLSNSGNPDGRTGTITVAWSGTNRTCVVDQAFDPFA